MDVKVYCILCFNVRSHKLESEIADSLFKPKKTEQTLKKKKKFFFWDSCALWRSHLGIE